MNILLRAAFFVMLSTSAAGAVEGTYEYKRIETDGAPEATVLNDMAEQGWHVLQIVPLPEPGAGMDTLKTKVYIYLERVNQWTDQVSCEIDEGNGLSIKTFPRMPSDDELAEGQSIINCMKPY